MPRYGWYGWVRIVHHRLAGAEDPAEWREAFEDLLDYARSRGATVNAVDVEQVLQGAVVRGWGRWA